MVARNDESRRVLSHPLHEDPGSLELAMTGALGEVSRHNDCLRRKGRHEGFERLDLGQICKPAEVEIGEMNQGDVGHQMTRMR